MNYREFPLKQTFRLDETAFYVAHISLLDLIEFRFYFWVIKKCVSIKLTEFYLRALVFIP